MNFENTPKGLEYLAKLKKFMATEIYPIEHEVYEFSLSNPTEVHPRIEVLKEKAKAEGLWNMFLPPKYTPYSPGLSNAEYAPLAEQMGKVLWASEVFNCNAPDTGNMEVLAKYGTEDQKQNYLMSMLAGKTRSAFLMTEPEVASSDARNIQTSIVRKEDHYLINGTKWWSSNAGHPHCAFYIVMGKTDPEASSFTQQSMMLVPVGTPGVTILRNLPALQQYDAPGFHCEIELKNVKIPLDHIILGEGRGFEVAQGRLGPGRIHHAMRVVGMAQRALDYMCKRANERTAFGKKFSEMGSVRQTIAKNYCEVLKGRQLTLMAADKIDRLGTKEAKDLIAAIKISVIPMASKVIDDAMQLFGGKGMSNDLPLAIMYAHARAMRLADGPEEVHAYQLGRNLIREAAKREGNDLQYFNELKD